MKLVDVLEYGGTLDDVVAADCRHLDVCLVFDRSGLKLQQSRTGYIVIPLYKLERCYIREMSILERCLY